MTYYARRSVFHSAPPRVTVSRSLWPTPPDQCFTGERSGVTVRAHVAKSERRERQPGHQQASLEVNFPLARSGAASPQQDRFEQGLKTMRVPLTLVKPLNIASLISKFRANGDFVERLFFLHDIETLLRRTEVTRLHLSQDSTGVSA